MGLDISVYKNIKPSSHDESDFGLMNYPEFKSRSSIADGYYSGERIYDFRAGSYSGYNRWREQLCKMVTGKDIRQVWKEDKVEIPFYELINFADNEGNIDAVVAQKLLLDFQANMTLAASQDENFYELYLEWLEAFRLTVNHNGVLVFH